MEVSEIHNLTTFLRFYVGFNLSHPCTFARNLSEPQTKRNKVASCRSHPQRRAPRSRIRPQRKRPALGSTPSRSKPQGRGLQRPLVISRAAQWHWRNTRARTFAAALRTDFSSPRLELLALRCRGARTDFRNRVPALWRLAAAGSLHPEPWPPPVGRKLLDAAPFSASFCFCWSRALPLGGKTLVSAVVIRPFQLALRGLAGDSSVRLRLGL